jgi:hypothetical protein
VQGNWYRADVTDPTLDNIFATEENAVSFSPYNLDPAHQTIIGIGDSFLAHPPVSPPASVLNAARARLAQGLRFSPDRVTPGTRRNPDPLAVPTSDYACYDAPDPLGDPAHPSPLHSLLVYLTVEGGVVHLKLRYVPSPCIGLLALLDANPALLGTQPWWGDYVR